ncbi:MAG: hypothetical protein IT280_11990 [Ignavibacteria bacterium]|nr:hypothetical protein [Ignavibacteria bacterium]
MKIIKSILFIFIFLNIIFIRYAYSQWIKSDKGIEGKQIYSLAYNNKYIFAGSINNNSGIYRSNDTGKSWVQVLPSVNRIINLIVKDSVVVAAADNDGIYVSINNGDKDTWNQKLNGSKIYAVANSGEVFYAGTIGKKLYKSIDKGKEWNYVSDTPEQIWSLIAFDGIILAGTTKGIYFSYNGGVKWQKSDSASGLVISFSRHGNKIFAGTHTSGIYRSTNDGVNWTSYSTKDIDNYLLTLENFLISGTYQGGVVVYSCNSSERRNEGLGNKSVYTIININEEIFIGTGNSVYRRTLCINPFSK